jgi:hypothetical protein
MTPPAPAKEKDKATVENPGRSEMSLFPTARLGRICERLPPMTPTETFIRDLRRDPRLVGHAANLAQALEAMDHEGDDVPDAKALFSGIVWVIAQPDTIEKRLEAISRLLALGKAENVNLREFYRAQ